MRKSLTIIDILENNKDLPENNEYVDDLIRSGIMQQQVKKIIIQIQEMVDTY